MPRLNGSRSTRAPFAAAASAVRSREPSSTTTISMSGSTARSSSMTAPIEPSSLYAGTRAMRFSAANPESGGAGATWSVSATGRHRRPRPQPDQLQQPPRAMDVRVLVESALAGGAAELLRAGGIVQQLAVGLDGLVRTAYHQQLPARLEPAFDPLVRIRDDGRPGHGQLERARRRRARNRRVGAARDVQVDPGLRDRAAEDVERP